MLIDIGHPTQAKQRATGREANLQLVFNPHQATHGAEVVGVQHALLLPPVPPGSQTLRHAPQPQRLLEGLCLLLHELLLLLTGVQKLLGCRNSAVVGTTKFLGLGSGLSIVFWHKSML
jgi:hypothetical protein